jgi:peroxiredoxin
MILPLGGLIAAALLIANGAGSDATRPVADYPSPPPVTFIPPTPRPTISPPQDSVIGEPLPAITLTALDGSSMRLTDFKDQIIFLNFWATWCVPCQDEMPALQKLQSEHGAEGVRVIAITDPASGQTEDDVRAFVKTYDLTLTVALSSDPALYQQFGVAQIPITFIIDRAGIVRYRHIGALNADDIATYLGQLTGPGGD